MRGTHSRLPFDKAESVSVAGQEQHAVWVIIPSPRNFDPDRLLAFSRPLEELKRNCT
jgi:hypothetical protein